MESIAVLLKSHPVGEQVLEAVKGGHRWPVDTPGGRFFAQWETESPVTREGQLIFFLQFLHVGARWEEFLRHCPLFYSGNRGSGASNVMGTLLLSVLCGHWRYVHINSVRGDELNPTLLGMNGTVTEDAVRAALKRMDEATSLSWLQDQILGSISPALGSPWFLDVDTTVKPLFGHQQGAQRGYTPHKPGRPSHMYHSYFVANLRISLGVAGCRGRMAGHRSNAQTRSLEQGSSGGAGLEPSELKVRNLTDTTKGIGGTQEPGATGLCALPAFARQPGVGFGER